jgi:hypothetical protein
MAALVDNLLLVLDVASTQSGQSCRLILLKSVIVIPEVVWVVGVTVVVALPAVLLQQT